MQRPTIDGTQNAFVALGHSGEKFCESNPGRPPFGPEAMKASGTPNPGTQAVKRLYSTA